MGLCNQRQISRELKPRGLVVSPSDDVCMSLMQGNLRNNSQRTTGQLISDKISPTLQRFRGAILLSLCLNVIDSDIPNGLFAQPQNSENRRFPIGSARKKGRSNDFFAAHVLLSKQKA